MEPTNPPAGRILALFLSPGHRQPMQAQKQVRVREHYGFEGDAHARPGGSRQVLLLSAETLREFGLAAGQLKENITTEGVALDGLEPGTRLRAGSVLLEITRDCAPCAFVDSVQPGLQEKLAGRRGQLACVLSGGTLHVGDPVALLLPGSPG